MQDEWGTTEAIMVVDSNGYESMTARSGVMGREGCHHLRHFADAAGSIGETICYDAENRPIVNENGCERVQWVRNARRHPIEVACFRAEATGGEFVDWFEEPVGVSD